VIWIESRRLLFIHNPKCAGTSIHSALLKQFPDAAVSWGRRYDVLDDDIKDMAHLTPREAVLQFGLEQPFRSFGIIRDPYTRFMSSYYHFKRWNPAHESLTPEDLAFDVLDEARIRSDWKFIHFAPQYRFFLEGKRCVVDRIWKFEDLPNAWSEAKREFSIDTDLAAENQRGFRYQEPMNERLIARINFLYARDFALFGYVPRRAKQHAAKGHDFYARHAKLWPERRGLDISDAAEN